MPKIKKDDFKQTEPQQRIFTDDELEKFHKDLGMFRVTETLPSGQTLTSIDTVRYHIHRGTMSDRNTVVVEIDDFGDVIIPTRYEKLENKFRQYKSWLVRREFKEKTNKKAEAELDKIVMEKGEDFEPIF